MGQTGDLMELAESAIEAQYARALALLDGFDHTPRIGKPVADAAASERSAGIPTRRRFRSTTPGLAARSSAPSEGVRLRERIENLGEGLVTPLEATAIMALRRALAIAMAVSEEFSARTALGALKRDNQAGALREAERPEFRDLLEAEGLITGHVFANALSFLLAPHRDTATLEVGAPEEILPENGTLMLEGLLWEIDQRIATFAKDDATLVAVLAAQAEQVMDRIAMRSDGARVGAFADHRTHIKSDDLTLDGFTPAARAKGKPLTMQFKKPHEVVGNHIAKHQALKLSKMLMAYDFERRMNPFVELGGGSSSPLWGTARRVPARPH